MKTTKQEAARIIDEKLKAAQTLLDDCAKLAEHSGVIFHLPWGGEGTSQSGMGALYVPETATEEEKKWNCNSGWNGNYYSGWQPSAGSC